MKNILIPTDFSENAHSAILYALTLFPDCEKYTLLNTYELPHSGATVLVSIGEIMQKESLNLLHKERDRILEDLLLFAGRIEVKSQMGSPDVVIRKMVGSGAYDMVVMGTKGASGLKGVLIGSVASNTMQNVKCPVIAVPGSADLIAPKKILFAVDDTSLKQEIFPKELVEMVRKFQAELLVLNIVPVGEGPHGGNSEDNDRQPTSVFDQVNHTLHFVEDDDVLGGVVRFIEDNPVDMIAMVSRRDDFFGKLFGLSITKQMMMHTHIPLVAFHGDQ